MDYIDWNEYNSREVEPLGEMATIGTTHSPMNLKVQINPDPRRIGNPYFKVFSTELPKEGETKVARLHFFDTGMEYHRDIYLDWVLRKSEIKNIREFLQRPHYLKPEYTNWQMACWLWNMEYGFIFPQFIDDYMAGLYDDKFVNDRRYPSYVPSTTPIPETWEYDPPKNKNKRK